MHLLITGGAGFVGSNLAIKFKQKYPQYTITRLSARVFLKNIN